MLVAALLIMAQSPDHLDGFLKMTPAERVAHFNRRCDRIKGANAYDDYARAAKTHVRIWELEYDDEKAGGQRRSGWEELDADELAPALARQWSAALAEVVGIYLERNAASLAAIRDGSAKPRLMRTLPTKKRVSDALAEAGEITRYRAAAKLALLKANQRALRGDWREAWDWNLCVGRLAAQVRQDPVLLSRMGAYAIEQLCIDQALEFLGRADALPPAAGLAGALEDGPSDAPGDLIDEIEALFFVDNAERHYAWAGGATDAELEQLIEFMVTGPDMHDLAKAAGLPPPGPRFPSVEAVRDSFRASSIAAEFNAYRRQCEIGSDWNRKPFAEAWREADAYDRAVAEAGADSPLSSLYESVVGFPASQFRRVKAQAQTRRRAFHVVTGVLRYCHERGRLPATLAELGLGDRAMDEFSGAPLRYVPAADGCAFRLYSVAADQKDDDGRHNPQWTPDGDHVFWPPPARARPKRP